MLYFLGICSDVLFPKDLNEFIPKEFMPQFDWVLAEDRAEDWLKAWEVLLDSWDSIEELLQVCRWAWRKCYGECVVVILVINYILGCLNFCQKMFACYYCLPAQVSRSVKDLVDVEVHLEKATEVSPESPKERSPQCVFLDAFLRGVEVEDWIQFLVTVLL